MLQNRFCIQLFSITLIFLFLSTQSCNGISGEKAAKKPNLTIYTPVKNEYRILGSEIPIQLAFRDKKKLPDSLICSVNGKIFQKLQDAASPVVWKADLTSTGNAEIEIKAYYAGGNSETAGVNIILLSDSVPSAFGYRILATYPHDPEAYTQGLLFDQEGNLYESTGNYGKSSIRRISLLDGKVLLKTDLQNTFFGEGIALTDQKIYQLTWNEKVAFVYDKSTLIQEQRLPIPTREGWGLTYDGEHLILSDGSSSIYFLDKNTLKEVRRIEVCDHQQAVSNLNELEYINGEIWANIYYSDKIAQIDPLTGKVRSYLYLDNLLKPEDRTPDTNVLNGIALNPLNNRIYVTGKNWPKLFEIELVKR